MIPIRITRPTRICGALYVTPQRVPGFAGEPLVTATVNNMVVSRRIRGLLPGWASFLRGVVELPECSPTASREDLVRDAAFDQARFAVKQRLFDQFERLARDDAPRLESLVAWHRYTFAGAALSEPRLRALLERAYKFPTSQGQLAFAEIVKRSEAEPVYETEFDRVVWYNSDRRQERWMNSLFGNRDAPCVHATRSFEESLLAAMIGDAGEHRPTDLRVAAPSSPGFAEQILGVHDVADAPQDWQEFLAATEANVVFASFRSELPVMAFLNEAHELARTFDDLKKRDAVPPGFQRLIDKHFQLQGPARNEILLNRSHRLVGRAIEQKTNSPLASMVRLLAWNALNNAGAGLPRSANQIQVDDLDWIADALWGRSK